MNDAIKTGDMVTLAAGSGAENGPFRVLFVSSLPGKLNLLVQGRCGTKWWSCLEIAKKVM